MSKQIVAGLVRRLTAFFINLTVNIVSSSDPRPELVESVALKFGGKNSNPMITVENLAAYVYENIRYYPLDRWLEPSHVLKLGIGDCKNQASLLQSMLERYGIASELAVGAANRQNNKEGVHTWVRVEIDGESFICDPTVSGRPMSASEYKGIAMGLINITPEYLLKDPESACHGVGKLSCLR